MSESFSGISGAEELPINLEKITTQGMAQLALVVLRRRLKKYQGIIVEARAAAEAAQVTADPYGVSKEKWEEQIAGIQNERIPELEAEIRAVEAKLPFLPEH